MATREMEKRKVHEIILVTHVRIRCLCGWEFVIGPNTQIHDTMKDVLLDEYNDHKRA